MTQTANTSALPAKKSEAYRRRLSELEDEAKRASDALVNEEPGAEERFDEVDAERHRLRAKLARAEEAERAEAAKEAAAKREKLRERIEEEAKLFSFARLEMFRAAKVEEALELEARLDELYVSIVDGEDAANAARERLTREAREAGLPPPQIPIWGGTEREIQGAVLAAHQRRTVPAVGLPPHIRQLKESQVPLRAERARAMIAPRRLA